TDSKTKPWGLNQKRNHEFPELFQNRETIHSHYGGGMYEDSEEQDESLTGMPGARPTRLNQFLSQVGSPASRYREAALQQQQPKQSGGLMDWIVDKVKGPLPDPPPSPRPPGPPNGAAGSPQFELVRAQDAARNAPRNQAKKP